MIETGTGDAAYYADVTQAVLTLAITAPGGPPADGAAFLDRLDPAWLEAAYAGDPGPAGRRARRPRPAPATSACATGPCCPASARPWTAPATWPDADAWYFILEGTREQSVAEAQAMALTELVAARRHQPRHRTPRHPAGL